MTPADFLCDFCMGAWDGSAPMVEGHRGSLICGKCLTVAYRALVLGEGEAVGPGLECTLCLETRQQSAWRSPLSDNAVACERCIRQAAQTLTKDEDSEWTKPARVPPT